MRWHSLPRERKSEMAWFLCVLSFTVLLIQVVAVPRLFFFRDLEWFYLAGDSGRVKDSAARVEKMGFAKTESRMLSRICFLVETTKASWSKPRMF